ncbi:MAG: hypothetical protein WB687_04270 [Candidatus Cybelea sp.]
MLLLRCVKRTSDDLDIYVGTTRSFEWYWNADDEMLGRDAFEELDEDDQDAILATVKYWGDLERGKHIAKSRVNEEHDDPKILAIKAGKHRFTVFHAGADVWIVCDYYPKQKTETGQDRKSVSSTNDRGHGRLCSTNATR